MSTQHLSSVQLAGLIGLGGFFWGVAALKIRYAGHIFYANSVRQLFTYIASIPVSYSMILFSEGLLGISTKQRLVSTTVMLVTALLMDGVAFMWFPTLYEHPLLQKKNSQLATVFSRMGAAWSLWGVGISLGVALLTY